MKRLLLIIVGILLIIALGNLCFSLKKGVIETNVTNLNNKLIGKDVVNSFKINKMDNNSLKSAENIDSNSAILDKEIKDIESELSRLVVGNSDIGKEVEGLSSSQNVVKELGGNKNKSNEVPLKEDDVLQKSVKTDLNKSNLSLGSFKEKYNKKDNNDNSLVVVDNKFIDKKSNNKNIKILLKEGNNSENIIVDLNEFNSSLNSLQLKESDSNSSNSLFLNKSEDEEIKTDKNNGAEIWHNVNKKYSSSLNKEENSDKNREICQRDFKNLLSKHKIHFKYASAVIKRDSFKLLNKLADIANECPDAKIVIEGHTDAHGKKSYNKKLSLERALAVKRYLIKRGVSAKRLEAIGYGELRPIATNKTAKGRWMNRRIEFKVEGG